VGEAGAAGVLGWGDNSKGQVGVPLLHTVQAPMRIDALAQESVACVAGGGKHSAAVDVHGRCWTWGLGRWGSGGGRRAPLRC
jgi:alpha-tubulin suppressor-like RCC1 family protein